MFLSDRSLYSSVPGNDPMECFWLLKGTGHQATAALLGAQNCREGDIIRLLHSHFW
jgi:hypothetical protein